MTLDTLRRLAQFLAELLAPLLAQLLKNEPIAAIAIELRRTGLGVRLWLGTFEIELI